MIGFTARPVMGGLYARTLIAETQQQTEQQTEQQPAAPSRARHSLLEALHM